MLSHLRVKATYPSFIQAPYFMTPKQFDDIVQRYLLGTCTEQERKLVEDWFNGMSSGDAEQMEHTEKRMLRQKIRMKLDARLGFPQAQKRPQTYHRAFRYAAALILVTLSVYLIQLSFPTDSTPTENDDHLSSTSMHHVINQTSSGQKISLRDGSHVMLEAGSELSYAEDFLQHREVHLKGEGFFEVARDTANPFCVYSGNIVTRVLGTSFRIKAHPDQKKITVSVKTGKVSVHTKTSAAASGKTTSEITLSPNQEAVYDAVHEKISQRLIGEPQAISTAPNFNMKFRNTPATEIFEALEKAYGIELQFNRDTLAECTLTTDLSDEGFYQRIEILCHALNAEYRVTETSVVIESKGCN
jgi:ferric-dicitrate binding protein FerR (iron transport regulator)